MTAKAEMAPVTKAVCDTQAGGKRKWEGRGGVACLYIIYTSYIYTSYIHHIYIRTIYACVTRYSTEGIVNPQIGKKDGKGGGGVDGREEYQRQPTSHASWYPTMARLPFLSRHPGNLSAGRLHPPAWKEWKERKWQRRKEGGNETRGREKKEGRQMAEMWWVVLVGYGGGE
jgi:hypothetical protein